MSDVVSSVGGLKSHVGAVVDPVDLELPPAQPINIISLVDASTRAVVSVSSYVDRPSALNDPVPPETLQEIQR